jgi:hypothetical protein
VLFVGSISRGIPSSIAACCALAAAAGSALLLPRYPAPAAIDSARLAGKDRQDVTPA